MRLLGRVAVRVSAVRLVGRSEDAEAADLLRHRLAARGPFDLLEGAEAPDLDARSVADHLHLAEAPCVGSVFFSAYAPSTPVKWKVSVAAKDWPRDYVVCLTPCTLVSQPV